MSDESPREQDISTDHFTVKEFAEWLLTMPSDVLKSKIWYIDVTQPYKGKGLWIDKSPSGKFVCIEDCHDANGDDKDSQG